MTITAITLENFKGIREPVRIELKPITLLFGPNSAGKSTIVQALHYAREIFEHHNLDPDKTQLGGDFVDLGGFKNLVHQHDLSLPIRIRLDFTVGDDGLRSYLPDLASLAGVEDLKTVEVEQGSVELTIQWSARLQKPILIRYEVGLDGEAFSRIEQSNDGKIIYISWLNFAHSLFLHLHEIGQTDPEQQVEYWLQGLVEACAVLPQPIQSDGSLFLPILDQLTVLPRWGRPLRFEEPNGFLAEVLGDYSEFVHYLSSCIVGPGDVVRSSLEHLCYLGPIREVPPRRVQPALSPDSSRWASGLAAYDLLFEGDAPFLARVNEWLAGKERLNSGHKVEVKKYRELEESHPLTLAVLQDRLLDEETDFRTSLNQLKVERRLLIRDETRDVELTLQDIGVGISQVLPVVVAALASSNGIVAIEQPELHIHPAFQVTLGDLFIEQVQENPEQLFLLETHSEHLLLRLLRRIRETTEGEVPPHQSLTPEELSINFLEPSDSGGIRLTRIRVDEDGDFLDHWPRGFFAERSTELF